MKGTITIEVQETGIFSVDMRAKLSDLDKFLIFDALAKCFELSDKERMQIGATIAVGGLDKITGRPSVMMAVPDEAADILRKKNGNEA